MNFSSSGFARLRVASWVAEAAHDYMFKRSATLTRNQIFQDRNEKFYRFASKSI